jgi:hypothetical protein
MMQKVIENDFMLVSLRESYPIFRLERPDMILFLP